MTVWCAGLDESGSAKPVSSKIDVVLKQLILLMIGTWLPETCREYK